MQKNNTFLLKGPCCTAMTTCFEQSASYSQVLSSDVGEVIEARLELLVSLVAYLLQAEINESVLKDGFPLPDIPHVHFVDLDLAFAEYAVKLAANVQYVP